MRGLLQRWTKSSIILTSKEESVWRNKKPKKRTVSFVEHRDRLPHLWVLPTRDQNWEWHLSSARVNYGWWQIRATWWYPSQQKPKTKEKGIQEGRERLVVFWDPGVAARIQGNFGGWWNSSTLRFSRQFFSWSFFRAWRSRCGRPFARSSWMVEGVHR